MKNGWQCLACSPLGLAVSLPSAHSETKLSIILIDACCTNSSLVVNSGVTGLNRAKLLSNVVDHYRRCHLPIRFLRPVRRMKVRYAHFANLTTELVERSEKRVRSFIFIHVSTTLKLGEDQSGTSEFQGRDH